MKKDAFEIVLSEETVLQKIFWIRGQKVMLDKDLAALYGVTTRRLKEQVRRNISRFPEDFMFELTKEEMEIWMSQFATSKERKSLRKAPFAFTEHGVLMLSSVLNSDRAIQMNIQIMRIFAKMREIFTTNKDILLKLEQLDRKVMKNDEDIRLIFKYLKVLLHQPEKPRKPIGYKIAKT